MRTGRLSLGMKFSIAVTLLIASTMFGVATLIVSYQEESLRQNTSESHRAMTENLAHDAAESLLIFDPLRLDELVRTVKEASAGAYAMVIDREGRVVAHTQRSIIGADLSAPGDAGLFRHLKEGREHIREYRNQTHGPVREFSHPVRIGSEVLGLATVAYSLDTVNRTIGERLAKLKKYIYLITGIMILSGIAGAFLVSSVLVKPLKRLKEKMTAVQAGNLDVEVENPRIVKCWERLDCAKEDCPSYGRLRCWAVAGTFCHGEVQGAFAQKIGDCRKCPVYRESCGDEIQELVEVFNQMVRDLRYNLTALERANEDKARMERLSALGEMALTVAHETKNPLNSIRLAAAYLKRNFPGDILGEFLSIIEAEARRLNDITTNFLGFSRPAPLRLRPGNINAAVEPTVELIRQEATDRNVEVVLLRDEHMPPVVCDISRIKQAVLNLLVNALDATDAGGTITVLTETSNGAVRIAVSDTGRGIPQDDLERIFRPFYSTKAQGSGLGLAIVERIVREHSGEITVDSSVAKGTKFTISLKKDGHGTA